MRFDFSAPEIHMTDEEKVIKKFLWLPRKIDDEWRWLEWAYIEYVKHSFTHLVWNKNTKDWDDKVYYQWKPWRWVDEEDEA